MTAMPVRAVPHCARFALIAGAAMGAYVDIGGGVQVGVASVVDLRTGQVVWHNLMVKQSR